MSLVMVILLGPALRLSYIDSQVFAKDKMYASASVPRPECHAKHNIRTTSAYITAKRGECGMSSVILTNLGRKLGFCPRNTPATLHGCFLECLYTQWENPPPSTPDIPSIIRFRRFHTRIAHLLAQRCFVISTCAQPTVHDKASESIDRLPFAPRASKCPHFQNHKNTKKKQKNSFAMNGISARSDMRIIAVLPLKLRTPGPLPFLAPPPNPSVICHI